MKHRRCVFGGVLVLAALTLACLFAALRPPSRLDRLRESGYVFAPTLAERAPAPRAVVTLCVGNFTTRPGSHPLAIDDDFCLQALVQTFIHLHGNNDARIQSGLGVEFAVLVAPDTPLLCQRALLNLGARLIHAPLIQPPLSEMRNRWGYTFTKLRLWDLEGVYDAILFVDSDLVFFSTSPAALFSYIDEAKKTGSRTPFVGGVIGQQTGHVNSGLILLEPHRAHFNALVAGIPHHLGFGDQRVINAYFSLEGDRALTPLPPYWNILSPNLITKYEEKRWPLYGFHHKFWSMEPAVPASDRYYERYAETVTALRRWQMKQLDTGTYDMLPIAPVYPKEFQVWKRVRVVRTKFDRVAILSLSGPGRESQAANRMAVANAWSQASLITLHQDDEDISLQELIHHTFTELFPRYDWVWIVHPALNLSLSEEPIHLAIESWTRRQPNAILCLLTSDCNQQTTMASFLVHKNIADLLAGKDVKNVTMHELLRLATDRRVIIDGVSSKGCGWEYIVQ
ncbi:hypothetical protein BC830DRAFT_607126 [Chytriomyces sp. MP71]|nr:hypothetical protein BC830DRAFT_607126 [Chytriomyces sp. MP71]